MRLMTFVILAITTIPAVAQPPRGFFSWWDSPIVGDLNLTEDQRQQIRNTVREYRPKLIDLRAAVEKAEGEVSDVFNEPGLDQRRGMEAIERLIAARSELTRSLSEMGLRLRLVLTPEQWQELQRRRPPAAERGAGKGLLRQRLPRVPKQ